MARTVTVIGASGEVGQGIVAQLLKAGHAVVAVARSQSGLDALRDALGNPQSLRVQTGSVADMASAGALADAIGPVDAVAVAVNGPRQSLRLDELSPDRLAELIHADLLTHFVAIRTFLPRLPRHGCFLGIGGGSADFILDGGVSMSMAQAALRQMYRGFAHEAAEDGPALRELVIASVVAGKQHGQADPAWVTPDEIGERVAAILADPASYPEVVWRIARRDASGRPVFGSEQAAPARILPL